MDFDKFVKGEINTHICKNLILEIINASQLVFEILGTGFSEHIYHRSLEIELRKRQILYETKRILPIDYCGINVGFAEADIIINGEFVVELKALSNPPRESEVSQVMTYLNAINKDHGIVINFPQAGKDIARDKIDFLLVDRE
jgi:GxxExxY protein